MTRYKLLVEKVLVNDSEATGFENPKLLESHADLKTLLVELGKENVGDDFKITTEYPNVITLGDGEVKVYVSRVVDIASMIELTGIVSALRKVR